LANGGYIIRIRPIANGILVVPAVNVLVLFDILGKKYPNPMPTTMARKIQSVKKRSKNFNFGCIDLRFNH
jgi:hypothetical protein